MVGIHPRYKISRHVQFQHLLRIGWPFLRSIQLDLLAFGKIFGYSCDDRTDFLKILEIIDAELTLGIQVQTIKIQSVINENKGAVSLASKIKSIHDGFETAKNKLPIQYKEFSLKELEFWNQYGINVDTLHKFNVHSIESYNGGFIYHHFIVVDDKGVCRTQINGNFLCKPIKYSHAFLCYKV